MDQSEFPANRGLVTLRAMLLACVLTALVATGAGVGVSYAVLGTGATGAQGPQGDQGDDGQPGEDGEPGEDASATELDDEAVWNIIEGDPARAAAAVQDDLDPSPAKVADDLSSLCSSLMLTGALEDEVISCP